MSGDQVVVCEGCGSKWRVDIAKGRASVIAKLEECPLCERQESINSRLLGDLFLAVEGCLSAVFGGMVGHGKSPCFSALGFLTTADVDAGVLIFTVADGVFFHE